MGDSIGRNRRFVYGNLIPLFQVTVPFTVLSTRQLPSVFAQEGELGAKSST